MLGRALIPSAIQATPEMVWTGTAQDATYRLIKATEDIDRWEVTATDAGRLIGYAVVAPDFDSNVGPVAGVQWLFVLPEYRGQVGREVFRGVAMAARFEELDVLAYTRRLGTGRYELHYRRLTPRSTNRG